MNIASATGTSPDRAQTRSMQAGFPRKRSSTAIQGIVSTWIARGSPQHARLRIGTVDDAAASTLKGRRERG